MSADDLFTQAVDPASAPLAARMRPQSLSDLVGHERALAPGAPLRRLLDGTDPAADRASAGPASIVLWGPPGSGKTTLAMLVATAGRRFVEVSAVSAGIKELRTAIDDARRALGAGQETVLFIDEVHRFSRTQQDALLPAVENRWVVLIAATTENPVHTVVAPLLSRSLLVTLEPLTDADISALVDRALLAPHGLDGAVGLDDDAGDLLLRLAGGDARRALTVLEAAAGSALDGGRASIAVVDLERAADRAMVRYDRAGDQHYDVISAFIKSIRGSDVDAALHYLARMLEAGEDPRFIARRLMILASEDIGLADSTALSTAVAAAQVVQLVGLPEARLALAHAVIALSLAPKSNAVIAAIDAAVADVRAGVMGPVPMHLRDGHASGSRRLGLGEGYVYPHGTEAGVVAQQYTPDAAIGREYYAPTRFGAEARLGEVLERVRRLLDADGPPPPRAQAEPGSGSVG